MCWPFRLAMAQVGRPSDARVVGQVVEEGRGAKILVFHYKRKKQYKKLRGHRQDYTAVRITEIAADGQSFKAPELPKKEPKVKKAAPEGESQTGCSEGGEEEGSGEESRCQEGCAEEKEVSRLRD